MKISLSRLVDTAKFTSTKSGKELSDLILYIAEMAESFVRALSNGLTFADNFNCLVRTVSVKHLSEQIVDTAGKTPAGMIPLRVVSTTTGVESFSWYIRADGSVAVKVGLTGAPSSSFDLSLVILFV